jgi:1-deoxy-D-xylulose-5-phosphate reductoisomerase
VAVAAFLDGAITWMGITELLTDALDAWPGDEATDIDAVLDVDRRAREAATVLVAARS